MLTGLSGSLLSHYFAECLLHVEFAGRLGEPSAAHAHRMFRRWWLERASQLGPASSLRSIWNSAAAPLAEQLGFAVSPSTGDGDTCQALLTGRDARVGFIAGKWSASLDGLWRDSVRNGIALETAWSLCTNGHQVRLVDTHRTYSRAYVQFDLQKAIDDARTFHVLWGVLHAEAFRATDDKEPPLVSQIIDAAARHGQAVNRSLRFGVIESVQHLLNGLSKCGKRDVSALFDESLTVVYRALFLMFAEARALVPNWHPLYKKELHHRVTAGSHRTAWRRSRAMGNPSGDCTAGPPWVSRGNARRAGVQRPPVFADTSTDR